MELYKKNSEKVLKFYKKLKKKKTVKAVTSTLKLDIRYLTTSMLPDEHA